jgi:hypothetical protein
MRRLRAKIGGNNMNAIAFQSEVKDDVIVIPEQYKGVFASPVLVTIIRDLQVTKKTPPAKKSVDWLNESWKIDHFEPLTREEIYDRT